MIAMIAALAASQPSTQDPPTPDIVGPRQLCFKYSSFLLNEGERVVDVRMGLEGMGIEVAGPRGSYSIRESEIFAPASLGRRTQRMGGTSYYRLRGPLRYAVTGRTDYSPARDTLVLWLSGSAFTGQPDDASIYTRVTIADPAPLHCDHRYLYGWDVALDNDE
ncbi:MAG: hypothetical protein Q8Q71_09215 [Brevundimonas sp.]|nr:hypothetical protein [Brevundimonas sp.]